ncbi:hypothetical protein KR018_011181 [Drosophila ironensis]|nr:hypothetical protein KR018_011181 [Drosophila ironensis]
MEKKTTVSVLQEFCAKTKNVAPTYEYIDGEDGGFVCKVTILEVSAYGNGRSKRDAKHLAAHNAVRKIRSLPGTSNLLAEMEGNADECIPDEMMQELTNSNRDMLKELRDHCVRHDMPLPTIEIVQQSGTPNAPEFVACCRVATITRYGKSEKKKDARQRAAIEMLAVISQDADTRNSQRELATPLLAMETLDNGESERRRKFSTYRELTESGMMESTGMPLADRHNYFKTYHESLKEAALEVLASHEYSSTRAKAYALFDSLKLTPTVTNLPSNTLEPLLQVELNCDFDALFMGVESKIYATILQYFADMLT